ncbi:MAG: hypothetical protein ACOC3V_01895 [bacterium]
MEYSVRFDRYETVQVRDDLKLHEAYYMSNSEKYEVVTDMMTHLIGKPTIITKIVRDSETNEVLGYKVMGSPHIWTDEMFY